MCESVVQLIRELIINIMNEKKQDMLTLNESKLWRLREFQWGGINEVRLHVSKRIRAAKEGIAVALNDQLGIFWLLHDPRKMSPYCIIPVSFTSVTGIVQCVA